MKNNCGIHGCKGHESGFYRCWTHQEIRENEDEWDRNFGAQGHLNRNYSKNAFKERLKTVQVNR